ncbi:MAG: mevalonate kinase [Methanoculleus sp.]
MATWSAPGKVFLFGEHAVVYGKPGVAMAIKPRVYVTVRQSRNPTRPKSPYIDECFKRMGVRGSVYVHSQLQSSSGLGSSAAVTVATLCAINDEFNLGRTRETIADIAFSIEKKVQRGRASPTDTYVCANGGMVLITGTSKRRLPPQGLQIVVGNTLVPHSTAKMVELVGNLQRKHPEIANPVLDAIGNVTLAALHTINNPKELGQCMDMNNALLEALGVGHPASSKLMLAARASGAYGAKITGAGGGGCIIALCPRRAKSRVAGAIEACEGKAIITTIDTDGARKEKHE